MSRVLITGVAGFLGSHLADTLLARGDDVVGIDNFDAFYDRHTKEQNLASARTERRFRFVECDIHDAAGMRELLTPDTAVVHLAAKAGVRPSLADPAGYAHANVEGTAAVIMAMRSVGATRLVFASSSSVYGDDTPAPFREDAPALQPVSPYAATKRAAELLLLACAGDAGLRAIVLRLFTVYGPRQRPDLAIHAFANRMVAGRAVTLFGDGTSARDYTFVADAMAGMLAALGRTATRPRGSVETINIGGNHQVMLDVLVLELAAALGVEPVTERQAPQPGDVRRTWADLTRARSALGYEPRTTLPDGLRAFVAWFRKSHALAN